MKIKKIAQYQNKLLKLKLSQSKIYNKKHYINNTKLEDIEYRLKKAFHIIYKYHVFKKKILFVGIPIRLNQKTLKNTGHFLIPETFWRNGLLTNKISFFKHLSKSKKIKNKVSKFLFQLKKNIDLIVLLNESTNKSAQNESYLAKIPTISLNSELDIQKNKTNYKIPGNFQFFNKKIRDNFFYSILTAILKKGKKTKKFFKKHVKKKHFSKKQKLQIQNYYKRKQQKWF
jgi:ribosomal protein S2